MTLPATPSTWTYLPRTPALAWAIGLGAATLMSAAQAGSTSQNSVPQTRHLPAIPQKFTNDQRQIAKRKLTLVEPLQERLSRYIRDRRSPVAALVMADARTGKVLAMVQGKAPKEWGGSQHTALHNTFPAASIFKNVVAAAAIEYNDMDPNRDIGLRGVCGKVYSNGTWLRGSGSLRNMTLHKAYGRSCNGFFAKIAVKNTGLGGIINMAEKFGWNRDHIPADFMLPSSPFFPPDVSSSSVQTVGKFAAGFGSVGLSALHAAWQMLVIANDGVSKDIKLFDETTSDSDGRRLLTAKTARKLKAIMTSTIKGGTATSIFRSRRYRGLRHDVGGKTGTLSLKNPKGITSWFTGMMPLDKPEVVVAAVVIFENFWLFKAPDLAAEAFLTYRMAVKNQPR